MRLAFWATTSSAIAVDMRSRPTLSPIMVRRSGLSVSQPKPLTSAPTARCQTCSVPSAAMAASTTDVAASRAIMAASITRRSKRSTKAPRKAPNRPIGSSRSMVTTETRNGELVSR